LNLYMRCGVAAPRIPNPLKFTRWYFALSVYCYYHLLAESNWIHSVCIYVYCVDLRTNSDYFTVQH
jgi:hypothetical protein